MAAIDRYDIHAHNHGDLLASLLRVHPSVVLDEMFSGDEKAQRKGAQAFQDLLRFQTCPLDVVSDETLLEWCDRDPTVRYTLIAASATLFTRPANDQQHEWTPLALQLVARAPEPRAVFTEIARQLHPSSWSGSLATKLEFRLKLLEQLALGDTPGITNAFNEAKSFLQKRIVAERKREADDYRSRGRRFE